MAPFDTTTPAEKWAELAAGWQEVATQWANWWLSGSPGAASQQIAALPGIGTIAAAFDAQAVARLNERYAPRFQMLWTRTLAGAPPPSTHDESAQRDRRFAAPEWQDQPFFALVKDAYLLYSDYLIELASLAQLPPSEKHRLEFATRQYLDAIAPTN